MPVIEISNKLELFEFSEWHRDEHKAFSESSKMSAELYIWRSTEEPVFGYLIDWKLRRSKIMNNEHLYITLSLPGMRIKILSF